MTVRRLRFAEAVTKQPPPEKIGLVTIVQARMGSSRFPGKSMALLCGFPLLQWTLERASAAKTTRQTVLATTTQPRDDILHRWALEHGYSCIRGPEDDVLERFLMAAEATGAEAIVRVTADCPLVCPELIDAVAAAWWNDGSPYDYAGNTVKRTFPDGLDVEVITTSALEKVGSLARGSDREHVTTYVLRHVNAFECLSVELDTDCSKERLVVDTREDLERLEALVPTPPKPVLGPGLEELLELAGCDKKGPKKPAGQTFSGSSGTEAEDREAPTSAEPQIPR
jgi:spore coat polysaccharide biosynthesis protein SpsF